MVVATRLVDFGRPKAQTLSILVHVGASGQKDWSKVDDLGRVYGRMC